MKPHNHIKNIRIELMLKNLRRRLSNKTERDSFVRAALAAIPNQSKLLDAGCGSQQYRPLCAHLRYFGQDFAQYKKDSTEGFTSGLGGAEGYQYGTIDYVGNIWDIKAPDASFDAILCTEVFEHIPYPSQTLAEFGRLVRPGGRLILTVPSNCLRHMDPYFFYSGFSNRFLEKFLADAGFHVDSLETVGDYYSWIAVELLRTMRQHSWLTIPLLLPAFVWYFARRSTPVSRNSLCMGYHVIATREDAKSAVNDAPK